MVLPMLLSGFLGTAQIGYQMPTLATLDQLQTADYGEFNSEARLPQDFDFTTFAEKHLKYPHLARTYGIEGTVILQLEVAASGQSKFVKVLQGLGYGCDEAAIQMTQELPQFIPAIFIGRQVSSKVKIEIRFVM